jgi:hypothetical protein
MPGREAGVLSALNRYGGLKTSKSGWLLHSRPKVTAKSTQLYFESAGEYWILKPVPMHSQTASHTDHFCVLRQQAGAVICSHSFHCSQNSELLSRWTPKLRLQNTTNVGELLRSGLSASHHNIPSRKYDCITEYPPHMHITYRCQDNFWTIDVVFIRL